MCSIVSCPVSGLLRGAILVLAVTTAGCRKPDPAPISDIGAAIDSTRRHFRVPGASVAVVHNGAIVLAQGFGHRNVDDSLPVTPQTLFAIGSCTKPFTAMAAVLSADAGRLSLDDHPRRWLPWFRPADTQVDSAATLRDLLSHRTGVPDDVPAGWYERNGTTQRVIEEAMRSRRRGAFRRSLNYNNYFFSAAGEAAAAANGMPFDSMLHRLIFQPLGMRSTSLSLEAMEASADFALGYHEGEPVRPTRLIYNTAMAPAANINSNAEDMARWLLALTGGDFMSERARAMMTEQQVSTSGGGGYALGWFVEQWHGMRLMSHPGGVRGYGTRCEFLPGSGLGWAVLTNVDDQQFPRAVREIIYAALIRPTAGATSR